MERAVVVALDTTELEEIIEKAHHVANFDPNWLIALALGMWDHTQSYPDAEEDLLGWLVLRLPTHHNDQICALAASTGMGYEPALRALAEYVSLVVNEMVDCIEILYARILSGFIYEGGWSITGLSFFGNSVAMRYDRTFIKDILTAQESLLPRLDKLYCSAQQPIRFKY